jgi:hypothetical protein
MPKKIVEATHKGKVVARYPIVIDMLGVPVTEQDFIRTAKKNLEEDGQSEEVITNATFRVSDDT